MAHIHIAVNPDTDLFTITLDRWEWQGLSIWENGAWVDVPRIYEPEVSFRYTQQNPAGPVQFKISADKAIAPGAPADMLLLKGPGTKTYFTGIMYTVPGSDVHLLGILTTNFETLPGAQPGPLQFSREHMTGTFNVGS
jgi:hypothetical protein